jgi:hypothetical protein
LIRQKKIGELECRTTEITQCEGAQRVKKEKKKDEPSLSGLPG